MIAEKYIDEKYKRVLVYEGVLFFPEKQTFDLFVKEVRFFNYDRKYVNDRTYYDLGAVKTISIPADSAEIVAEFGTISANDTSSTNAAIYIGNRWLDYAKEHLKPQTETLEGKKVIMASGYDQYLPSQWREIGDRNMMSRDEVLQKYGLRAEQLAAMTFSPYLYASFLAPEA